MLTPMAGPMAWTAGLVLASTLVLASCNEEKAETKPDIRPVKVVEIAKATNVRALEFSGSVKSRTEMNLGFRIAGKVTERLVDIGDRVRPGDVLSRIDPRASYRKRTLIPAFARSIVPTPSPRSRTAA